MPQPSSNIFRKKSNMLSWINVKTQLPTDKQRVWYFSPILGLWRGTYSYSPSTHSVWYDENNVRHEKPIPAKLKALISPHVFSCDGGCCDTDEVTHWMPDEHKECWAPLPPMYEIPSMEALRKHGAAADPPEPCKTSWLDETLRYIEVPSTQSADNS